MFRKKILSLILVFSFLIFSNSIAYSVSKDNIKITGNSRISTQTIIDYLNTENNTKSLNSQILNNFQKSLIGTGFFSDVKIKFEKNILYVDVQENPFIKFFYVDGVSESENEDLIKLFSNKKNSFFTESKLKIDSNNIIEFFQKRGFYNVDFKVDIAKLDQNSINLIYNIKKNKVSKINDIKFIGNKNFSNSDLFSVINSSRDGWWKFLSSTTKVNIDRLNYDISLLKKYYINRGYYDFEILTAYYEKINDYKSSLLFSLYEGEKYNFGEFKILNSSDVITKDTVNEVKIISKNYLDSTYSKKKIGKLKNKIDDLLYYKNILNTNYRIIEKKNKNKIDLFATFAKIKNTLVIQNINIVGNDITNDKVVRRNLLYQEGDIYNEKKNSKSLSKLKSLGIFENVTIEKNINSSNNTVNVKISVIESPTGEISAGAGAGSNGALITGGIKERNFLGNGNSLSSSLNLATEKVEGNISFTNNDFRQSGQSLTSSLFATKFDFTDSSGYENSIYGTKVRSRYEIYEDLFFGPGGSLEFTSFNAQSTASETIKKRDGDYWSSKILYTLSNDKRNSSFNPTEGYEFGIGQTLSALVSDVPSIESSFFGSYYQEIAPKFNSSIKYRVRAINSLTDKDILINDRLHLTDSYLRGFKSRGVGPIDGDDHVGGNYSVNSSAATTIPSFIPETWNIATGVFMDAANVWGIDYDKDGLDDSNSIRMSVGLGINWISPLGPLSVSYATPIMKESTDDVREFSFNLGTVF